MNLALRLLIVFLLMSISVQTKEYYSHAELNHKLWKISGKGLDKPSYILTGVVSKHKDVFFFNDSVFSAFMKSEMFLKYISSFDKDMYKIEEYRRTDNFDFEKYFSSDILLQIGDTIESRGGFFQNILERKCSYDLMVAVSPKIDYSAKDYLIKSDIMKEFIYLTLVTHKNHESIFDINHSRNKFLKLPDSLKYKNIIDNFRDSINYDNIELTANLFSKNQLDSIYSQFMNNEIKDYDIDNLNSNKDSVIKSLIYYFKKYSTFTVLPIYYVLGEDGVIVNLRNQGFEVEGIECPKETNILDYTKEFDRVEWVDVKNEKLGINIKIPPTSIKSVNQSIESEVSAFDIKTYNGYFGEYYDCPNFSTQNPEKYFYETNEKTKTLYTKNASLKRIYSSDSIIRYEGETYRNRYYTKYHLVYANKLIIKITGISDTNFRSQSDIDRFLSSYTIIQPNIDSSFHYISESKDFEITFPGKPFIKRNQLERSFKKNVSFYDFKTNISYEITVNTLSAGNFHTKDSLLNKFADITINNNKDKNLKIINDIIYSDFNGFNSVEFNLELDNYRTYYKMILAHDKTYLLRIYYKDTNFIPDNNPFINSFIIYDSNIAPRKVFKTKTASFLLPDNLLLDSMIEDNLKNQTDINDRIYFFNRFDYHDTNLGFSFYFKINLMPDFYFKDEEKFFRHSFVKYSLNYLTDQFGKYDLVYCKPYSQKIQNSYEFLVKSKTSQAVLKGIFYPYKQSIQSFEVRTHQEFLDNSYINDVFESFNIKINSTDDEELFSTKLIDVTKYLVENRLYEVKIGWSSSNMAMFEDAIKATNSKIEVEKSIEFILQDKEDISVFLEKLFIKYSELYNQNEVFEFHKSIYEKAGKISNIYNYMQLAEISKIDNDAVIDFVLDKLIQLRETIKIDFSRQRLKFFPTSNTSLRYAKNTFQNLNLKMIGIISKKDKLKILFETDAYAPYKFDLFSDKKLDEINELELPLELENQLIKQFKNMYYSDLSFAINDEDYKKYTLNTINNLINVCKSEESFNFFKDSIMNQPFITDKLKSKFYTEYIERFDDSKREELIENVVTRFNVYDRLRKSGKLNLFPEKYLNYKDIAEAQITKYYKNDPNNQVELKFKNFFKHTIEVNNEDVIYYFYHIINKTNFRGYHGEEEEYTNEFTLMIGPYNENSDINNLQIPYGRVCIKRGFRNGSVFDKFIKSQNKEEFEDIFCIENINEVED